ncbi:MAG: hypothetical protein ACRCT1_15480 [Microcoleaceae cyanobacterium]
MIVSFNDTGLGRQPFSQYTFQGRTYLVYQLADFENNDLYLSVSLMDIGDQVVIIWRILSEFDSVTNTSINQVDSGESYLSKTKALLLYGVIHPEIRGVCLVSGSDTFLPLCYMQPANKSAWWNEYLIPFIFLPLSLFQSLKSLPSTAIYNNTNVFSFPTFSTTARDNMFDIAPEGVCLLSNSGQGYAGYFEDIRQTSYWPRSQGNVFNKSFLISRINDIINDTWVVMSSGLALPVQQIEIME